MKIVTVNVPESFVIAIDKMVGTENNSLYPSRSELIRVAVREYLLRNLHNCKMKKENTNIDEEFKESVEKIKGKNPILKRKYHNCKFRVFKIEKLDNVLRAIDQYPGISNYNTIREATQYDAITISKIIDNIKERQPKLIIEKGKNKYLLNYKILTSLLRKWKIRTPLLRAYYTMIEV